MAISSFPDASCCFSLQRSQVLDTAGFGTKACGRLFLPFSAVSSAGQPSLGMLSFPIHLAHLLLLEAWVTNCPPMLVEKGQGTVLHACPPPVSTAGLEFTCLRFIEHGLCTHALATPACRHFAARNSGILHLSKRVRLMQSPSSSPGLVTCRLGLYKEALSFYRLQGAGSLGAAEFCFLQPPYVPSVTLRVRVSLKSWQGLGVCAVLSVSGTQFSWPLVPLLGIS